MPELPEVETIRRSLLFLEGETICEVEVHRPKSIRGLSAEEFARKLEGRSSRACQAENIFCGTLKAT